MAGPKQRKKLKGVELARKRQPTGRLLADVLKKSKKDIGKPTGRTLAKLLDTKSKKDDARKKYKEFIKKGLSPMKKILKGKKK